ncbi:MAG: hypothetical protein JKY11_07075 [Alphaproteobacteria bacterium]|nr:hypothetical protein [Alphaproteobacteria bacterium]
MIKDSFTSQAGQQFLRRVFQVISETSQIIETRKKRATTIGVESAQDQSVESVNQQLIVAKTGGAVYINDINTLGEIAIANSKRSKNKLFHDHDFTKNVRDLKILFDLLDDPIKRHSFLETPENKIETPAIGTPPHRAEVIPIKR